MTLSYLDIQKEGDHGFRVYQVYRDADFLRRHGVVDYRLKLVRPILSFTSFSTKLFHQLARWGPAGVHSTPN